MRKKLSEKSTWDMKPKHIDKVCEHGRYISVCPHHPKIYARGLSEDTYQQLLNIKAYYHVKYGLTTWREVLEQLAKDLSKRDWI